VGFSETEEKVLAIANDVILLSFAIIGNSRTFSSVSENPTSLSKIPCSFTPFSMVFQYHGPQKDGS